MQYGSGDPRDWGFKIARETCEFRVDRVRDCEGCRFFLSSVDQTENTIKMTLVLDSDEVVYNYFAPPLE